MSQLENKDKCWRDKYDYRKIEEHFSSTPFDSKELERIGDKVRLNNVRAGREEPERIINRRRFAAEYLTRAFMPAHLPPLKCSIDFSGLKGAMDKMIAQLISERLEEEMRRTFMYGRGCGKTPVFDEDTDVIREYYNVPPWMTKHTIHKPKFLSIHSLKNNKSMKNLNCGDTVFYFGEAAHFRKPKVCSGVIFIKRTIESLDGKAEIEYTVNGDKLNDDAVFESKEALLTSL